MSPGPTSEHSERSRTWALPCKILLVPSHDVDKICSVIESSIKRIHPSIDEESYLVESIPVEIEPKIRGSKQNRYVIVVSVFAGASRPYLPYSNCGHYFTRVGASVVTNPIADSSV